MALSLGIRLVILLPTFLFFVGFSFKSLVDKKALKELESLINSTGNMTLVGFLLNYFNDFFVLFSIDSIFILIANGLIIIFELEQNELGILTIIFGIILSVYVIISIYAKNIKISKGAMGIFYILGAEFFYFLFYGTNILPIDDIYRNFLIIIVGGGLGGIIGGTLIINTIEDSANFAWSYSKERCKKCEEFENCKFKLEEK